MISAGKRWSTYRWILLSFLLWGLPAIAQDSLAIALQDSSRPPVAAKAIVGTTSEEIRAARRSNLFVLTLTQGGRLFGSAYRGMHPGFLSYEYLGYKFSNPISGFWNEQLFPHHRIVDRQHVTGKNIIRFGAQEAPGKDRPESRIVFSQDYVYDINYFDAGLNWRFAENRFIQLGGSNFTGAGSEPNPDYGEFKKNSYTVRYHHDFSDRWSVDANYWQLRNRFRMASVAGGVFSFAPRDKFQQVEHTGWIQLLGKPGTNTTVRIVPGYHTARDRYWQGTAALRINRNHILSLDSEIQHDFSGFYVGANVFARHWRLDAVRTYQNSNENGTSASVFLGRSTGRLQFSASAGLAQHSELESEPIGNLTLSAAFAPGARLGLNVQRQARPVPLLWRQLQYSPYAALTTEKQIADDVLSAQLSYNRGGRFHIMIEPFAARSQNNWQLSLPDSVFQWQSFSPESQGIRASAGLRLGILHLENDFTFTGNYQEVFAPKFNNIFNARLALGLFSSALKIDAILSLRTFDYYEILTFDRLIYQYRSLDTVAGPINIADFRLQAYFRDAAVYMIFENFLSEDYWIENSTLEQFRIFRIGVDWLFFD